MSLRKALGWSGASSSVRILLGFFSAKVSAAFLGPEGMLLVGQISSLLQIAVGTASNGTSTAVVSLTAERAASADALRRLWATSMRLVLAIASIGCILAVAGARPLSAWLLFDAGYWPVVTLAGIVIILAVVDAVLVGVLNGLKQVNLIGRATLISALVEFSSFVTFTYFFGVWGALFAMCAIYAARLAVSSFVAFRSGLLVPSSFMGAFDRAIGWEILRFYPMLLAHSIALPLALILIRKITVHGVGLETAGYLQATWRLSDVYMTVLQTALGMFFLAEFAEQPTEASRGAMLRRTVLRITVVTAVAAGTIYALRGVVIPLVLSRRFLPMTALLPYQLAGDVIRMAGYPLLMALVSRRRVMLYVTQVIAGQAVYVWLTYSWLPVYGAAAAPRAYAFVHLTVLIAAVIAWRPTLFARSDVTTAPAKGVELAA